MEGEHGTLRAWNDAGGPVSFVRMKDDSRYPRIAECQREAVAL